MAQTHAEIQRSLAQLQSDELSIIRLAEPISSASACDASKRGSDASADAFDNPTPASLAADLTNYKVRKSMRRLVESVNNGADVCLARSISRNFVSPTSSR